MTPTNKLSWKSMLCGGVAIAVAACGGPSQPPVHGGDAEPPAATSFVLVHGAWMGAWSWDAVAAELRARGAAVTAVELPGHGDDDTPAPEATLDAYVATVASAVDASAAPPVLVGHSMAGMVISAVAEQHPEQLRGLVYLAAYVPKDGQTLQELAATDAASHVGPALHIDPDTGLASIDRDQLEDVFCADCSAAAAARLHDRYRDEPLPAFAAPVHVSPGRWGQVARRYIYTTQDHAVSLDLQQRMTAGIDWTGTATLDTSHAPLLSQPALVADTLARAL